MEIVQSKLVGNKKKAVSDCIILAIAIAISILIRYIICGYIRTISVYPDELRYLSLARSLAHNGKRLLLNLPYHYEYLLYSICLIPAALISNKVLQLKMMALTNCILLSLGVIPIYLLARKCVKKRKSVWLACLIYLLSSDIAYSCSLLRENLYLPLSIWVFYILFLELQTLDCGGLNRKTIGISFLCGAMIWLLYFCKRTCFPLFATLLLYPFLKWIKNIIKHQKTSIQKNTLINLLIIVAGFLVPYFLLKYTVFYADDLNQVTACVNTNVRTMANVNLKAVISTGASTNIGTILNNISSEELRRLGYGIYFFIYYILILFFAYTFFPFLVTFNEKDRISASTRHLFYYTLISLLITTFWVTTNTNIWEDLGKTLPRIHLRYLMIYYVPLIICFLAALETKRKSVKKKWLIWISVVLIISCIYFFSVGDHLLVGDWDLLQQTPLAYFALTKTKGQILGWLTISALMITGMVMYVRGSRKFNALALITVIGLNVLNGTLASCYFWPKYNRTSQDEVEKVEEVSAFIEEHADKTFVVVTGGAKIKELWHTYIDEQNVVWLDYDQLNNYVSGLDETADRSWYEASKNITNGFQDEYYGNNHVVEYYNFDHVDYIIWPSSTTDVDRDMLTFQDSDGTYSEINEDTCVFSLNNTKDIPEIDFGYRGIIPAY